MSNLSRDIPAHVGQLARQQIGYGGQIIIVQQPAAQPAPVVVQPAPVVVQQPLPVTAQGTVVLSP
jgi:hypothetical protein